MNFNLLCCVSSLTVAFLSTMGVLIYNDMFNSYQPYVPAVYQTNTAPMMLTSGNWTCVTNMETYQNSVKRSELKAGADWWADCNPKENCQTMMTWLESEINEENQLVHTRHVQYYHKNLIEEQCMVTSGTNSMPYYYNMSETEDMCMEPSDLTYQMKPGHCLSRFTFRNMLNGDYLIESTYNVRLMKKWMGMVGKMYDVKYLDPCYINLQFEIEPSLLDNRMHCVLDIKPMEQMSSYELKEQYDPRQMMGSFQ